jgi:hypothetical protein
MRYSKLTIVLFAAVTFASCKKKEGGEPSGKQLSALESKVVGKWQLVSSIDSNTALDPARVADVTPACEKDDAYIFSSDQAYTIDDGTNKCAIPMSGGSWKVDADSLFHVEIVHTLSSAYPKLIAIDAQRMIIQSRYYGGPVSGSVYTTNTYRKL